MPQFLGLVSGVLMTWPRPQVPQFVGLVPGVLMTWPRPQVPQFVGLVSCSNDVAKTTGATVCGPGVRWLTN